MFVVAYVGFVLTPGGQTLDDLVYVDRDPGDQETAALINDTLHLIRVGTIALGAVLLLLLGIRRWRAGLLIAVAFGLAAVSAEVFKAVLPRPDYGIDAELAPHATLDTFPSGHVTIAASFSLALVLVGRPQRRGVLTVVGATLTVGVALGVVAAGWHRPSDVIGALALSSFVMAGTALVLTGPAEPAASPPTPPESMEQEPRLRPLVLACAVPAVVVLSVVACLALIDPVVGRDGLLLYLLAQAVLAVLAAGTVLTFSALCGAGDLGTVKHSSSGTD